MSISKIFAAAGKYGTVAVEIVFVCLYGLCALVFRKQVVIPVKEDTRAELASRGYTLEEIKEAEAGAKDFIIEASKSLVGYGSDGRLQGPEGSEVIDAPQDEVQPQASTP